MILFVLQQQRIFRWKSWEIEKEHGFEGYESEYWKKKGHDVSGQQVSGWEFKKNIHVVFVDRVLVAILLCVLRVTDGFIKGAVASQVDWGTMLSLL